MNTKKELPEMEPVQGLIDNITEGEDEEQLRKMKLNKAKGPDEVPIEMVIALGDLGVEWISISRSVSCYVFGLLLLRERGS